VVTDRGHHVLSDGSQGSTLDDPVIGAIAQAHGKSPAQVMLRWGLQEGRSVIPKSTNPIRIAENIDVFDFELAADEISAIDGLDTGRRGGPDPTQSPLRRLVATFRRPDTAGDNRRSRRSSARDRVAGNHLNLALSITRSQS
jgi:hypothetical protein